MKKRLLSTCAMTLAFAMVGTTAWSQTAAEPEPAEAAQPAEGMPAQGAEDFSEQQLAQFAEANKQIGDIEAQYTAQLKEDAEDPEKVLDLQRQAQDEMVQAVEDNGLDVRTYNQIFQVAQADPDLAKRIQDLQ